MARTRLHPQQQSQQQRQQLWNLMNRPSAPPPPTAQACRLRPTDSVGVKRIQGPRRDKRCKIKQKIQNSKNVDVKHRGQIVRRMTVHRRAVYPATIGGVY